MEKSTIITEEQNITSEIEEGQKEPLGTASEESMSESEAVEAAGAEDEQTQYYHAITSYDAGEHKLYFDLRQGPVLTRKSIIFCAVVLMIGIGLTLFLKDKALMLIMALVLVVFDLGGRWLIRTIQRKRDYTNGMALWGTTQEISLYPTRVERNTAKESKVYSYDDFYTLKENLSRMYLIAAERNIVIIEKEKCDTDVQEALRELWETPANAGQKEQSVSTQNFLRS